MENGHEIGTWNVRSLYRSGSLSRAARELSRYKLDIVGVCRLGETKGAQLEQGIMFFIYSIYVYTDNENHQFGTGFFF
jgi:hypothetical protein